MGARARVPDFAGLLLIVSGLILIFFRQEISAPTTINVAGQEISSSNVGLILVLFGGVILISNGDAGGIVKFSVERIKSQFLTISIAAILGTQVGIVYDVRAAPEVLAGMMVGSLIASIGLVGLLILPKLHRMDLAFELKKEKQKKH